MERGGASSRPPFTLLRSGPKAASRPSRQKKIPSSCIEEHLEVKSVDKTQFAIACAKHLTVENMKDRFDWEEKVTEIVDAIRKWNA